MKTRNALPKSLFYGPMLGLLLLSGCGTMVAYEGAPQPKEAVALVKTPSGLKQFAGKSMSNIICVDGKRVSGLDSGAQVLPGKHQIEVSFLYQPIWGSPIGQRFFAGYIDFEALAGREYVATGDLVNGQATIWIEDNNSRQVVARGVAADKSFQNHVPCN